MIICHCRKVQNKWRKVVTITHSGYVPSKMTKSEKLPALGVDFLGVIMTGQMTSFETKPMCNLEHPTLQNI